MYLLGTWNFKKKNFILECGELLEYQGIVYDSFFFLPLSLVDFFLSVEAVSELRAEGKKTRIPLDSNFIFGVYDYSVVSVM